MTRGNDGIGRAKISLDPRPYPEESLLRIPLVRHALEDRQVRFSARGIDRAWSYEGIVPVSVVGFNPFAKRVFYGAESRIAKWLERPAQSARALNAGDFLVHEVLFAVHDYLHAWAYVAIAHLEPKLGFGTARITQGSLEDFAFCHVVSEAVATVGLDYWYLSTIRLNEVCDLGTRLRGPLTVPYHEDDLAEFRRFDPTLDVQSPKFFARLVALYCDGVFEGFDARDVDRSAMLLRWMRHEISYARTQREGIRGWLSHLAGPGFEAPEDLFAPIDRSQAWKKRLVSRVGALLWEKVKDGVLHEFRPSLSTRDVWRAPPDAAFDYRFLNARVAPPGSSAIVQESFPWLVWQTMSARHLRSVDRRALRLIETVIDRGEIDLAEFLLRGARPVESKEREVRELFIPN